MMMCLKKASLKSGTCGVLTGVVALGLLSLFRVLGNRASDRQVRTRGGASSLIMAATRAESRLKGVLIYFGYTTGGTASRCPNARLITLFPRKASPFTFSCAADAEDGVPPAPFVEHINTP